MKIKEKKLISLKEAAAISGYSADYIGQLIRAGKIPGKQVYSNIAWMTTAEAVLDYKNKNKKRQQTPNIKDKFVFQKRRLLMELDIMRLFFQTFKAAWPLLILIIVSFVVLTLFVFKNLTFDFEKTTNLKSQDTSIPYLNY